MADFYLRIVANDTPFRYSFNSNSVKLRRLLALLTTLTVLADSLHGESCPIACWLLKSKFSRLSKLMIIMRDALRLYDFINCWGQIRVTESTAFATYGV